MYVILEGMPSSGKTTLARALADAVHAAYIKSVLSVSKLGSIIRELRDRDGDEPNTTLLHIIDLLQDELHVRDLLANGDAVVRDKCFLSSIAHLATVGCISRGATDEAVHTAYAELARCAVKPDMLIYLDRPIEICKALCATKADATSIDQQILRDKVRFETQQRWLRHFAEKYYGDRLIVIQGERDLSAEVGALLQRIEKI